MNAAELEPGHTEQAERKGLSSVELTDIIGNAYAFYRGDDDVIYFADPDSAVVRPAKTRLSGEVRRYLHGIGKSVGRDTLAAAIDTVLAIAEAQPVTVIHSRAAQLDGRVIIDLGHDEFIIATADGWYLTPEPGVLFRRGGSFARLVTPERNGNPGQLAGLLGLSTEDRRWKLIRGWLAAAFLGDITRPMLWIHGYPGSGKSTRGRMIARLIDGTEELGDPIGKNYKDDIARMSGRYLPTFDNVSHISEETSDAICRMVTGSVVDARGLYTDNDLRAVRIHRTAIATSVSVPFGLRADALDRLILIEFEKGKDPADTAESELWAVHSEIAGQALGCVLDDLVLVLRHRDQTPTTGLGRHGDYARACAAVDLATGSGLAPALLEAAKDSMVEAAESDPLITAIRALHEERGQQWRIEPTALWRAVVDRMQADADGDRADGAGYRPRPYVPKSAKGLSALLKQAKAPLAAVGIDATQVRSNGGRHWEFSSLSVVEDSDESLGLEPTFVTAEPTFVTAEPTFVTAEPHIRHSQIGHSTLSNAQEGSDSDASDAPRGSSICSSLKETESNHGSEQEAPLDSSFASLAALPRRDLTLCDHFGNPTCHGCGRGMVTADSIARGRCWTCTVEARTA